MPAFGWTVEPRERDAIPTATFCRNRQFGSGLRNQKARRRRRAL